MKSIIIILSFILSLHCFSQEVPVTTQKQLENLAEVTESETTDDVNLLQQLEYYSKHPLNLNEASADELRTLHLLTDLQIFHFIQYRSLLGKFISVYELQAVPTWDVATIKKILPYILTGDRLTLQESFRARLKGGDQEALFRVTRVLEQSAGYDTSRSTYYLGDRNHLLLQYRYHYKNLLQYGFAADKDAGEQFFKGAQRKGFDFYSFHFFTRNLGNIKALAIGDYSVNLGQGLIQWHSLAFKKSTEVLLVKRQAPVLLPYRSAGEFFFNRGIGATYKKGKIESTVFVSSKKISGNFSTDTLDIFSSYNASGYYRSKTEAAERNNLGLRTAGGNITYASGPLKIGINGIFHQFSSSLQKRDEPYNLFSVSGKNWFNGSIDYSYTYKSMHLFGEIATDKNFSKALITGALFSADPKVDISLVYRNIQKEYGSLFGNAFTENVLPTNEKGFYMGLVIKPLYTLQLNAYMDFYSFPWLRYRVDAPGVGRDYSTQITYKPNKVFELYARYRNEIKSLNTASSVFNYPSPRTRQNMRIHFSNTINRALEIKGRVEMIWYDRKKEDAEEGFSAFIEGSWRPPKPFSIGIRLQYFETDGYDSRIYAYENDVLYSFSIPAFFDKGFRYYINAKYEISKNLNCWVRLAQTVYQDRKEVGSGLDEIQGNRRTELKLQLRWLF